MTSRQPHRESLELAAFLRRMGKALVRRARGGDMDALVALVDSRDALNSAIVEAARSLHYDFKDQLGGGYSWGEIARELGMTRQAARQRFAREDDDE